MLLAPVDQAVPCRRRQQFSTGKSSGEMAVLHAVKCHSVCLQPSMAMIVPKMLLIATFKLGGNRTCLADEELDEALPCVPDWLVGACVWAALHRRVGARHRPVRVPRVCIPRASQ